MKLTTDKLGDVPEIDAAKLDELLASDGFGDFAILSASDEEFIQTGSAWQPGAECEAFLAAHGSDPRVLEYREDGHLFRASGHVTLDRVRQAFRSYLVGEPEWRTGFVWRQVVLETTSPDGVVTNYRPDGTILSEAVCVGSVRHGPYRDYWPDGRVSLEGQYRDGLQEGEWRFYDQGTGELREVLRFVAGREVVDRDAFFGRSHPDGQYPPTEDLYRYRRDFPVSPPHAARYNRPDPRPRRLARP